MRQASFPSPNKRVIIFAGAYGSGKTEVAVNYVVQLKANHSQAVSIIDLDIVNPYFRSREAAQTMETYGVHVIMPHGDMCHADMPIILPEIRGEIERPDGMVVLDVGGDDLGARVLSSMVDAFTPDGYEFLMVLNARRPFTSDVAGSLKMMREIETSSRLQFTGIVSNTHLIGETTVETVVDGYNLATEVGKAAGIPVVFVSVVAEVAAKMNENEIDCPILEMSRQMLKPWEEKIKFGPPLRSFKR